MGTYCNNKHVRTSGIHQHLAFWKQDNYDRRRNGLFRKSFIVAKKLRDHGMNLKKYWHDYVGFNYRMTNLQAALGLAQM